MNAKKNLLPSVIKEQGIRTVVAGHFNHPDSYAMRRPDGMSNFELTYTLDGSGYFVIDGEERLCQAGDVTLMQPGDYHQYGTRKGNNWHFMWAHFTSRITETVCTQDKVSSSRWTTNPRANACCGRSGAS